ncbi:MAG: hypothetical protein M3Y18_01050 [Candidatus Eremiobacteraeota bacterium]|nr:hypothetical protein [Candidatus Eremiobacteraeota bacterium]
MTSSRSSRRVARQARIAARYAACVPKPARAGRFGKTCPQRTQRYLSRRFALRRASDHQWLFQNAVPQCSLHQRRLDLGRGFPHQAQPLAVPVASEQRSTSSALLKAMRAWF